MPSAAGGGVKSVAPGGPLVKPWVVGMVLVVAGGEPLPEPVVGALLGEPAIIIAVPLVLLGLVAGVPVLVPVLEPAPLPLVVAPGLELVFDATPLPFAGDPVEPPPDVPEPMLPPPLWPDPVSVPPPNPPPVVGELLQPTSARGSATITLATVAMVRGVLLRTMIHLR